MMGPSNGDIDSALKRIGDTCQIETTSVGNELQFRGSKVATTFLIAKNTGFQVADDIVRQPMLFPVTNCDCQRPCRDRYDCDVLDPQSAFPVLHSDLVSKSNLPGEVARLLMRDQPADQTLLRIVKQKVAPAIQAFCNRWIATIDPIFPKVQRAIFAANCGIPKIAFDERLYQDKYLVSDILRFRAAAIVVANAVELAWLPWKLLSKRVDDREAFERHALKQLEHWQNLVSPTMIAYRSLRRTLMQWPGGVPPRLIPVLSQVYLEKPITDRVVLTALLTATELIDTWPGPTWTEESRSASLARMENLGLLMHATRDEIRDAVFRVGTAMESRLSPRRADDIRQTMEFLLEYPFLHRGRLGGLTRKSVAWHRDRGWERFTGTSDSEIDRRVEVEGPPIEIPHGVGIRLLKNAGEIYDEGLQMQHCVANYVEQAIAGECYLFHVDRACSRATVMVDRSGRVVQAHGPCNRTNLASRHGTEILSSWGLRLCTAVAC